jgi:hypothetical protein
MKEEVTAMNRHERRTANALARRASKSEVDRIVAIHEAGHAIAKVLASGELGYDISEAIEGIEIGPGSAWTQSIDRRAFLASQGVTFGPTFSREISASSSEFQNTYLAAPEVREGSDVDLQGPDASEFFSRIVELGRAAGADIKKWFRARVFDAVSGSVAEAIWSHRSFHDVWEGYQAESDLISVVRDAKVSGIGVEEVKSTIERMAALSACVMEDPLVWAAVLALAEKLPNVGHMKGFRAIAIITSIVPEPELIGMFARGVSRLTELESEMRAADVMVASMPDGSQRVIKGKDRVARAKENKEDSVSAQVVSCRFSVFWETLCRAFGDGAVGANL